jgi:hypothetical protein
VNPLRALLTALTPEIEAHDTRMRAVGASLKALRSDVRSLHREAAAVAGRAEALSRQLAQLRRLRIGGGLDTATVLDELAAVLATERVAPHLRAAVERASHHDEPVPGLVIEALWPADVHAVLKAAIPDVVFFDQASAGARTLRVPPRLAPVSAIAVWTRVSELIEGIVVPAIVVRFGDRLTTPLDITPARLVRRETDGALPPFAAKPWQTTHLVIDLTSNAASVTVGSGDRTEGGEHTYEVWFGSKPA